MIIQDEYQITVAVLAETERAAGPRFMEMLQALVRHFQPTSGPAAERSSRCTR